MRPARAQRYTEFLNLWGYPEFAKPPAIPHRRVPSPFDDHNADWYEAAKRLFTTERLKTITERYEDMSTAQITEMRPVWRGDARDWGCSWYEVETTRGASEDMCKLKGLSDLVDQRYGWPHGRWMYAQDLYYKGMDALAYKAIDAILVEREARQSFHWLYRACGVPRPRYENVKGSYDYVDVYIDVRIDLAGNSERKAYDGHAGVPNPHLQFTVFTPVDAAWVHDRKPRGPYKWMSTEVGTAMAVPGNCLMEMLRSKTLPCIERFYDAPNGIRRRTARTIAPWQSDTHKDTDFLPPFNELEVVSGWEREDGSPEDYRQVPGWVRNDAGTYINIPIQRRSS
ncbi:hypothetical protein AA313_de0206680 [Arthrobotrys entomopaga]|nr:hypothetical protein AA313_de0206680 [Arthrobotrys entomopaga]